MNRYVRGSQLVGLLPGAMGTRRRFALWTVGRTGSSLLVKFLDQLPAVRCELEVLRRPATHPLRMLRGRQVVARWRDGAAAWGFKATPTTALEALLPFPPSELLRHLVDEQGVRIVALDREDTIRQAVSTLHGFRRSFHYRTDDPPPEPFRVDPVDFIVQIQGLQNYHDIYRAALDGVPHLALTYERHLADSGVHQDTVDRVASYLGVESAPVRAVYRRGSPDHPADLIQNWQELVAFTRQTKFAHLVAPFLSDA